MTPLELVRAYGVFATLGKRFEPDLHHARHRPRTATRSSSASTRPRFERVMSPADRLRHHQHAADRRAAAARAGRPLELGRPVAGKTGTTNDTHDAWFIGFTPDLLAGVWVGFDSERSLGKQETGGHAAAPIWTAFMKQALDDRPVVDFPVPGGRQLRADRPRHRPPRRSPAATPSSRCS